MAESDKQIETQEQSQEVGHISLNDDDDRLQTGIRKGIYVSKQLGKDL